MTAAVERQFPDSELWGHPTPIWWLFITEMWERFSYYGMRALLIFYMTKEFLFSDNRAYDIYGSYTALVYLSPVFGGYIADKLLGNRKAVTVGALLMALGHFCMAIQTEGVFYLALALLIIGNGFFKPNMSTLIGRLYKPGDPRRDSGYTIFYMGVNLGAMLSPIGCGLVGEKFGLHWGFTLAGVGMLAGLFVFLSVQKKLGNIAEPPDPENLRRRSFLGLSKETLVYVGGAIAVLVAWKIIQIAVLVQWTLILVAIGVIVYLLYQAARRDPVQRHRIWVAIGMMCFSLVFWAFFEQAGSSLQLFTDRNVNLFVGDWRIPAAVMQSINPFFILTLGAVFAWLWVALARKGMNPSTPMKFALGIIQLGLGFAALFYGAWISQESGIVGLSWLVLGYLLHTTGELCLSPVGLSMISKLAPADMSTMMMGSWYLSNAFANKAAGVIAKLTSIQAEGELAAEIPPAETVMVYGTVFGQIALIALGVGIFAGVISPFIRRGMHGVD